jgi:hypothetical protein
MTLQPTGNVRTCPERVGDVIERACGMPLVGIKQGNEMVYGCPDHGWQATVFEDGSGDAT